MQEPQTTSSASFEPRRASGSTPKALWLAVGALAVAVAALGGTLIGMRMEPTPAPSSTAGLVPFDTQAPAQSAVKPPRAAPAVVRAPAQPTAAARCESCGTVVAVTPVQRAAPASGVGAVAGGVVGGVLGNQVGGGSGRAVATVLGAVGGGFAGNEAEKRIRQTTHYAVRVRMDDGSIRTFEQSTAVAVGRPVVVEGGGVRLRESAYSGNG